MALYSPDTDEILLLNEPKHVWNRSPKIVKRILTELSEVKNGRFVVDRVQGLERLFKGYEYAITQSELDEVSSMNTLSIGYRDRIDSILQCISISTGISVREEETEPAVEKSSLSLTSDDLQRMAEALRLNLNAVYNSYDELRCNGFVSKDGEVITSREEFEEYVKRTVS